MITGELKNKVDKIWEIFWTGGITNPLEVIEQFNIIEQEFFFLCRWEMNCIKTKKNACSTVRSML